MKNYLTATELKKKVSEVLNDTYFKKSTTIIERYGKPIAKITPISKTERSTDSLENSLNKYFGILPDFPEVTKERKSRRKEISL